MAHDPEVQYVKKYGCVFDVDATLVDDDSIMGMVRQSMISYLNRQGTVTGDISLEFMSEAQQMAEGVSLDKRRIMASGYAIADLKERKASVEPTMNIVNQINAGLSDVRETLVALIPNATGRVDRIILESKAKYQLELLFDMIYEHGEGKKIPWSDRKLQVEEEFS